MQPGKFFEVNSTKFLDQSILIIKTTYRCQLNKKKL